MNLAETENKKVRGLTKRVRLSHESAVRSAENICVGKTLIIMNALVSGICLSRLRTIPKVNRHFGKWFEGNINYMSIATAEKYMRFAKDFSQLKGGDQVLKIARKVVRKGIDIDAAFVNEHKQLQRAIKGRSMNQLQAALGTCPNPTKEQTERFEGKRRKAHLGRLDGDATIWATRIIRDLQVANVMAPKLNKAEATQLLEALSATVEAIPEEFVDTESRLDLIKRIHTSMQEKDLEDSPV